MSPDPSQGLDQAEAYLEAGKIEAALAALAPSLETNLADGWFLAAQAAFASNQLDQARVLLKRAQQGGIERFLVPSRVPRMRALQCTIGLHSGKPVAGPGPAGLLGSLLLRQPAPNHPDAGTSLSDAQIHQICAALVKSSALDSVLELLQPRAEALFPGIGDQVRVFLHAQGHPLPADEPDYIFIGGAGRSGTTLLRAMLDAHPRISCGPELKLVPTISKLRKQWEIQHGKSLKEAGVGPDVLDQAVRAFIRVLLEGSEAPGSTLRVAEKTPHNLLHIDLLASLFPRARFLHIIRDGRAVVASLMNQQWEAADQGGLAEFCESHQAAATYWKRVVGKALHDSRTHPGRCLEIRYEHLVESPRTVMQQVLAFLGEPWDESVLAHHRTVRTSERESSSEAIQEPIHRDAVDKWVRQLSAESLQIIEDEAGPLLRELGYAPQGLDG